MIFLLFFMPAAFASTGHLQESDLPSLLAGEHQSAVARAESEVMGNLRREREFDSGFSPRLTARWTRAESLDEALSTMDGGISREQEVRFLGIEQNTLYGVKWRIGAESSKVSNLFLENAHTLGPYGELQWDLSDNFLGKKNRMRSRELEYRVQGAHIKKDIQLYHQLIELRKIFWRWYSHQESKRILNELLKKRETFTADLKKRYRAGIATLGELAKAEGELSQLQTQMRLQDHYIANLESNFKGIITNQRGYDLSNTNLKVDAEKTLNDVLGCSAKIAASPSVPLEYSWWDKVNQVDMMMLDYQYKSVTNNHYQLNLLLGKSFHGRGFGSSQAYDAYRENPRSNLRAEIAFSLPLDSAASEMAQLQRNLINNERSSQSTTTNARLTSVHQSTLRSIEVLNEVLKSKALTGAKLATAYQFAQSDYKRAKISLSQLLLEEQLVLNNKLNDVQTDLLVVEVLLSYLQEFQQFPCEFNLSL